MKRILLYVGIACCALQMQAQEHPMVEEQKVAGKMPHEIPNPEKIARRETDRLKAALALTDKQYKKVYKLLLKEQRELFENRMPHPPVMNGRPGRDAFPPGGEGMPPMGGGWPEANGERGMGRPPMPKGLPKPETPEDMRKRMEKKNKKMKKILTETQYNQWLNISNP